MLHQTLLVFHPGMETVIVEEVHSRKLCRRYELGKVNERDDYRSGNSHNSKCPPNDSLEWCIGYKIGYDAGWFAARTLGGQ
ncbi:MAG: hypothetical protein ACRD5J_07985 [Nitrososphaeraceae archaeon]